MSTGGRAVREQLATSNARENLNRSKVAHCTAALAQAIQNKAGGPIIMCCRRSLQAAQEETMGEKLFGADSESETTAAEEASYQCDTEAFVSDEETASAPSARSGKAEAPLSREDAIRWVGGSDDAFQEDDAATKPPLSREDVIRWVVPAATKPAGKTARKTAGKTARKTAGKTARKPARKPAATKPKRKRQEAQSPVCKRAKLPKALQEAFSGLMQVTAAALGDSSAHEAKIAELEAQLKNVTTERSLFAARFERTTAGLRTEVAKLEGLVAEGDANRKKLEAMRAAMAM